MTTERVTMPIYGLTCTTGETMLAERALRKVRGVTYVYVNPATEMAYVEYDATICQPEQLTTAMARTGFSAGAPRVS
jgi:copper chaperone CopZ